ncbi:MAG TPA: hypothetical protein DEA76_11615, partial [Erwinia persicina]|nr:hypothetical protein [Erwinia persicina]
RSHQARSSRVGVLSRRRLVQLRHTSKTGFQGPRDSYTRNILRPPASNKLRMEGKRGEEYVKIKC